MIDSSELASGLGNDSGGGPLVSVVIPTFNRAACIERSILSVLNQTYRNIELIVVDDCSNDNTEEVISKISDWRLTYIRLDLRSGACAARNKGVLTSTGKYVAFQDSDDEWVSDKLDIQVSLMMQSPDNVGLIYSRFDQHSKSHTCSLPKLAELPQGHVLPLLLKQNFISTQVMLVRRDCFSLVGQFDEKLKRLQDWEFAIRMASHYDFMAISRPLANVYLSNDSISINESSIDALMYILDKHRSLFENNAAAHCLHLQCITEHFYIKGNILAAQREMGRLANASSCYRKALYTLIKYMPSSLIISYLRNKLRLKNTLKRVMRGDGLVNHC
jgi:glycosyltransferase involved in cell wall biosynthesis